MSTIDFSRPIPSVKQLPLYEDIENTKPVILKNIVVNALVNGIQGKNETGQQKVKNFLLASKIEQATESVDLDAEDIVTIKNLVGEIYSTQIAGPVLLMLDGKL